MNASIAASTPGDVARGQQVEQQSAHHGHAQPRVCASQRTRDSEADIDLGERVKPVSPRCRRAF
jgi:hypothetical protein